MRIRSFGAAALSALLCACGAGEPDFIESVDVPAAAVMDEFAALPSYNSVLNRAGVGGSRVRAERNGSEIRLTIPSSASKQGSTFLLRFESPSPTRTSVAVTIDVPAVSMGLNKELSEAKVEDLFHKDVRRLLDAIRTRQTTRSAAMEFVTLFDGVTVATNPAIIAVAGSRGREMERVFDPETGHYEKREISRADEEPDEEASGVPENQATSENSQNNSQSQSIAR